MVYRYALDFESGQIIVNGKESQIFSIDYGQNHYQVYPFQRSIFQNTEYQWRLLLFEDSYTPFTKVLKFL